MVGEVARRSLKGEGGREGDSRTAPPAPHVAIARRKTRVNALMAHAGYRNFWLTRSGNTLVAGVDGVNRRCIAPAA
jgi:hypothetical protein